MNRHSVLTLTLGAMLLGGVTANAQYRGEGPGYRDGYAREGNVIGRVMGDVDLAARNSYLDRREQQRLWRVREDLQRFDERWRRGQWDQGRLDSAISNLSRVADNGRMDSRDRRMMFNDANLLREFRSNRGRYSGVPYGSGYRR
jgi:hypothetical protein